MLSTELCDADARAVGHCGIRGGSRVCEGAKTAANTCSVCARSLLTDCALQVLLQVAAEINMQLIPEAEQPAAAIEEAPVDSTGGVVVEKPAAAPVVEATAGGSG